MEACCRVVHKLEDKFHGLELNHVLCRYNKVTDTLAKATSNRKLVPNGVFVSDQHTPSVCFDEGQPKELDVQEDMHIDPEQEPNLEDLDW
jgi:hypothetical protein